MKIVKRKEIKGILDNKVKEYGFELNSYGNSTVPYGRFIYIDFVEVLNEEKSNADDDKLWYDIKAVGNLCKLGQSTSDQLIRAAEEYLCATRLINDINNMNIAYIA